MMVIGGMPFAGAGSRERPDRNEKTMKGTI